MSKIAGQLLISGQFQDNCEISGISGQLGALIWHTWTFFRQSPRIVITQDMQLIDSPVGAIMWPSSRL